MRTVLVILLATLLLPVQAVRAETMGQNELPIHDAARTGDRKSVEAILKATPAMRDAPTAMGSTPLHLAAMNGDTGPLKALLAAGAPVNVRDRDGATPLHMAAYASRLEATQLLLQAGADPALKTDSGRDALSMARKVMAHEVAGALSLWQLKGCKPARPC